MTWRSHLLICFFLQIGIIGCLYRHGHHRFRYRRSYYPSSYNYNYYLTPQMYASRQNALYNNEMQALEDEYARRSRMPGLYQYQTRTFLTNYFPARGIVPSYGQFYGQQSPQSYPLQMMPYHNKNINIGIKKGVVNVTGSKRNFAQSKSVVTNVTKNKEIGNREVNSAQNSAKQVANKNHLEMIEIPFKGVLVSKKAKTVAHNNNTLKARTGLRRVNPTTQPSNQSNINLKGFFVNEAKTHYQNQPLLLKAWHKINDTGSYSEKSIHSIQNSSSDISTLKLISRKKITVAERNTMNKLHSMHGNNSMSVIRTIVLPKKTLITTTNKTKQNVIEPVESNEDERNKLQVVDIDANDNNNLASYIDDEDQDDDIYTPPTNVSAYSEHDEIQMKEILPKIRHLNLTDENDQNSTMKETLPKINHLNVTGGKHKDLTMKEIVPKIRHLNVTGGSNKNVTTKETTPDDRIVRNKTTVYPDRERPNVENTTDINEDLEMTQTNSPEIPYFKEFRNVSKHQFVNNSKDGNEEAPLIIVSNKTEDSILGVNKEFGSSLQETVSITNPEIQKKLLEKNATEEVIDKQSSTDLVATNKDKLLGNDRLNGDWFDTAHEPSKKTKNDLKISSNLLQQIAASKMKGKKQAKATTLNEESESYDKHVKKITDMVESSENEMLSNLIRDSLGNAMPSNNLNPLKLKTEIAGDKPKVDKDKGEAQLENIQLKQAMSRFGDDFDGFVDNTAAIEKVVTTIQPTGHVVKSIDTMDDFPDKEVLFSNDVTGSKKHLNSGNKGKHNNIALKRLLQKWKVLKEANKIMKDETKKQIDKDEKTIEKTKVTKDKNHHANILDQYFHEVENRQQDLNQSKKFISKQVERKEKLKSTLNMISDIEHEIDKMVNNEALEDASVARKRQHKNKGKAKIFSELVDTNNLKEPLPSTPRETGRYFLLKNENKNKHFSNKIGDPETQRQDKQMIDGSEQGAEEQLISQRQEPPENDNHLINEETDERQVLQDHHPHFIVQNFADQENRGDSQLIQHKFASSPSLSLNTVGNTIENAISASDENEHINQANDLRNLQRFEMQGDLARLKEATQNGLREMFSDAVQKQENFINAIEGRNVEEPQAFDGNPQRLASIPEEGGDNDIFPPSEDGEMAFNPRPISENNEPLNSYAPDSEVSEGGRRKSGIMRFLSTDSDDEDDGEDMGENDGEEFGNDKEGEPAMLFLKSP